MNNLWDTKRCAELDLTQPTLFQPILSRGPAGSRFGAHPKDYGKLTIEGWIRKYQARLIVQLRIIAEKIRPYTFDDPPHDEGIYFLFRDGALRYVGKAVSIQERLYQHYLSHTQGWFTHYAALWVPFDAQWNVERFYIHQLKPPENRCYATPMAYMDRYVKILEEA